MIATTTMLADIRIAPTAGVSRIPQGASTPAASGMAKISRSRICQIKASISPAILAVPMVAMIPNSDR